MKGLFAVLMVLALFFCSCLANPTDTPSDTASSLKDNIDGCYTSSCTMPHIYDKEYDPAVIGTFSLADYQDEIESQTELMQKATSNQADEGLDEVLSIFNKNYGKMDSDRWGKVCGNRGV